MKMNRLMMVFLMCLSLSATSAFACDGKGNDNKGSSSGWFSWFHHCDHDGDHNSGSSGNGGHQCSGGNSGGKGDTGSSGGSGSGKGNSGGQSYK